MGCTQLCWHAHLPAHAATPTAAIRGSRADHLHAAHESLRATSRLPAAPWHAAPHPPEAVPPATPCTRRTKESGWSSMLCTEIWLTSLAAAAEGACCPALPLLTCHTHLPQHASPQHTRPLAFTGTAWFLLTCPKEQEAPHNSLPVFTPPFGQLTMRNGSERWRRPDRRAGLSSEPPVPVRSSRSRPCRRASRLVSMLAACS